MFISYIPEDIIIEDITVVTSGNINPPEPVVRHRQTSGLIYVLTGQASYTFGSRTFSVKADDIFYLAQGDSYSIHLKPGRYTFIHINFVLTDSCRSAFHSDICMGDCRSQYLALFQRLESIYKAKEPLHLTDCRITLYNIMMMLLRSPQRTYMPSSKFQPLHNAVKYMEQNYASPTLTIGEISQSTGLCEGYMRRLFKAYHRVSPSRYLQNLRLSHAKDLLLSTTLSISDVAEQCGFSSTYYFSEAFRRHFGISPTAWRDTNRTTQF
ncbi:MAG: helix-turn-helix transcriptional regulator [Clostridia bacterium]|nr:helix-turn-helix transcriptional regulator [Clostridia bacterium]